MGVFNYINKETREIVTPTFLALQGINDAESLGYVKVRYNYPEYDNGLYQLEVADLHEADNEFIQEFKIVDRNLDDAKLSIKERVTIRRKQVEEAGITIDGIEYKTTTTDQSRIANIPSNESDTISFKASNVWVEMNAEEVTKLKNTVADYVEKCFKNEHRLHDLIDSCSSIKELAAFNIDDGWPSREL